MNRIRGTFRKYNGTIMAMNDRDALAFLEKNVHNRDRELGDHRKGHFRKVLRAAWAELKRLAKIVFDPERYVFILNERFDKPRGHRQKYPAGRLAYAR